MEEEENAEGKVDGPAPDAGLPTSSSPFDREGSLFSFLERSMTAATPTKTTAPTKSAVNTTMAILSQFGAPVNQRGIHPPATAPW